MLEVMTPEQTERYVEITSPEFIASFLRICRMCRIRSRKLREA